MEVASGERAAKTQVVREDLDYRPLLKHNSWPNSIPFKWFRTRTNSTWSSDSASFAFCTVKTFSRCLQLFGLLVELLNATWRSTSGQASSHLCAIQRHQRNLDAEFQQDLFQTCNPIKGLKILPATESCRNKDGCQLITRKTKWTSFVHFLLPDHRVFLNLTSSRFTPIRLSPSSQSAVSHVV